MKNEFVKVKEFQANFNFEIIFSNEESLNKKITNPETNHPGLELVGFHDGIDHSQGIIIGSKEIKFIKTLTLEQKKNAFKILTSDETPFIILTRNYDCPVELLEMAKEKNISVFKTSLSTTIASTEILLYIYEKLSDKSLVHGTLVEVYGAGVLITGDSGIGKSEIALELIKNGHRFVADDGVLVHRLQNHVFGQSTEHLKNLLEVRGIGLVDIYSMFGITAIKEYCEINYVINLTQFDNVKTANRLQTSTSFETIKGVKCPKITLPVTSGRSMANLVEVAVVSLRLQSLGINTTVDFINKYDNLLKGGVKND